MVLPSGNRTVMLGAARRLLMKGVFGVRKWPVLPVSAMVGADGRGRLDLDADSENSGHGLGRWGSDTDWRAMVDVVTSHRVVGRRHRWQFGGQGHGRGVDGRAWTQTTGVGQGHVGQTRTRTTGLGQGCRRRGIERTRTWTTRVGHGLGRSGDGLVVVGQGRRRWGIERTRSLTARVGHASWCSSGGWGGTSCSSG
jgi:hypothetical protein